jgi:type IV secretory pathway protease TraF
VDVFINDELVAKALLSDEKGRDLPAWDGCVTLRNGELFLRSPHPSSLDGRYFGPVREADILGVAVPLMVSSVHGLSAE